MSKHLATAPLPERFIGLEPRPLSEDERALLTHLSRWGSDGIPVRQLKSGKWLWEFRSVHSPTLYATKREALEAFERFESLLVDLHAYASWRRAAEASMKPKTEELIVEPDRDAGIVKMLDLSTAHITEHDGELLTHCAANRGRVPLVVIQDEYRWIVYTWLNDESESQAERDQKLKAIGMSKAFIELLAYARRLGCKWVMLDCDADLLPGLPTFDW